MKHCFLVTSAIVTKFGTFEIEKRLNQTLQTIKSIKSRAPDSTIIIIESSADPIPEDIFNRLKESVHWIVNLSGDPTIKHIQESTDNWDIVKNMSELLAFNTGLKMIDDNNLLSDIDRIHKISGRYELNENFNPTIYERFEDKIIVPMRFRTQFLDSRDQMDVPFQYMSRLWSWPKLHHEKIREFYSKAIEEFIQRLKNKKRMDIEHLMFLLLPNEHIKEVPIIGVKGQLGQNGRQVEN